MVKRSAGEKVLETGSTLFRQAGYAATSVEEICEKAGVTKGAFFYHYKSKEALGAACLAEWDRFGAALDDGLSKPNASDTSDDPVTDLVFFMDGIIELFAKPGVYQSCLAGTIIHEFAQSNPQLKDGVQRCFTGAEGRFQNLLDAVCRVSGEQADTASLACLWLATMQGPFTLYKASGNREIGRKNLGHVS